LNGCRPAGHQKNPQCDRCDIEPSHDCSHRVPPSSLRPMPSAKSFRDSPSMPYVTSSKHSGLGSLRGPVLPVTQLRWPSELPSWWAAPLSAPGSSRSVPSLEPLYRISRPRHIIVLLGLAEN
jgi:hypothetical protein